jgi:hypothetical protein
MVERGPVWIGHKHRGEAAVGYFAGLDVSLEETAICIVDDAGVIVREARAASEPEALIAFFEASGMAMERVGLEACSLTAWLHQAFTEAGIVAICIEARQAKAAMGAMPNKTDRNDARGIAQILPRQRLTSCTRRSVSWWWSGIFWRKPSVDERRTEASDDRTPTSSAIGGSPVRAGVDQPVRVLLPACRRDTAEPGVDAAD